MKKLTEDDIIEIIKKDKWMMDVLKAAESLNLPDWWTGGGFIRSKIWDYLHEYEIRTELPDVDFIYFDSSDFSEKEANEFSTKSEDKYQEKLKRLIPDVKWSVTNQARMHLFHKTGPYKNSTEALTDWAETATCIGVRLEKEKLVLLAPHGIEDLVNLIARPNPLYKKLYAHDPEIFQRRVKEKNWLKKWPKLRVID